MKKKFTKISIIISLVIIIIAASVMGVATIVRAKSLINYYDSVSEAKDRMHYEKLRNEYLPYAESYPVPEKILGYTKWVEFIREDSLKEIYENGLKVYVEMNDEKGKLLADTFDGIPLILSIYNDKNESFDNLDRVFELNRVMDEETCKDFWEFYNELSTNAFSAEIEICGKYDDIYIYPEFIIMYFNNDINCKVLTETRKIIKDKYSDSVRCWHYVDKENCETEYEIWEKDDFSFSISGENNIFSDDDLNSEAYVFEFPQYTGEIYGELKEVNLSNKGKFTYLAEEFISYDHTSISTYDTNLIREYGSFVNKKSVKNIKKLTNYEKHSEDYMFIYDDVCSISYYANPLREAAKDLKKGYIAALIITCVSIITVNLLIRDRYKKKKEYEESTKRVYGAIAHELKTPLGVLKMYNEMINSGELDKETESEYRKIMDNQIDDMDKIIRNMIDCAKLEAGIAHINPEEINLSELVKTMAARQEYNLKKRKIEIDLCIGDNITVNGDLQGITYIVSNLLNNAIKYTAEDEQIYINISESDKWVRFSIKNTVHNESLAVKQYNEKNIMRDVKRDGIGLLIVKGYIELHKGEWGYVNKDGYCNFYFKLRKEINE